MLCPCCTGLDYDECCKPYHMGSAAPTALALMRSRYSAYALGLVDYIIQTTHPKNMRKKTADEIRRFSKDTQFVKLEIEGFGEDWVAFAAHLMQEGHPVLLKEKSRFAKLDGKWLYLSGVLSEAKSRDAKG
jgi:SEC-C motif domain protein